MTPEAMPLPPWTARPDGLSIAIKWSSSNRIGTWRRGLGVHPAAGASASANRGHPHDVTGGEPRFRPHPALVDPYLAAAQDPVDVAFRDAFKQSDQKVVDPLPGGLLANGEPAGSILA